MVTPRTYPGAGLRARLRAHPVTSLGYRLVVAVVAVTIILAGVAMLVLPGPGVAAILLGLALLGTEFPWAQRMLKRILAVLRTLKDRVLAWWDARRNRSA